MPLKWHFSDAKAYKLNRVPSAEEDGKCINASIKKLGQLNKPKYLH